MNPKYICDGLEKTIQNPRCELNFNKDYELPIAVMLSAQSTDKRVNIVTKEIFKKYDSLEKLSELNVDEIGNLINTIGMYKTKAKYFKSIVGELLKYKKVPNDRELLESIPGLGRKSTNVILSVLYNEPFIAVDTHVNRVSKILGIADDKDNVLEVEQKLYRFFDKYDYKKIGQELVLFGRYICTSKNPKCSECPFEKCKYRKNID